VPRPSFAWAGFSNPESKSPKIDSGLAMILDDACQLNRTSSEKRVNKHFSKSRVT
jgi:hypothetical protein